MATSLTLSKPSTDNSRSSVYEAPQQVQYLYLEAEIDVLLRQLQTVKAAQN